MSYYLRDIIELRKNFAGAYKEKRYADAIELGSKIIELYKENNDCSSENYADDLNNLAIVYDDVRAADKAAELYKEAAEIKSGLLGENSESYIETIENLGALYSITGSFDKAEELLKKVNEAYRDICGTLSPKYVKSLYNLGNMYTDRGKFAEAGEYLDKALEHAKKLRDFDVADMEDIRVSIGRLCKKSGNYKRALDEYERAVKISEEREEEPSYFKMRFLLAYALLCQRCELYDRAAEIYESAVAVREELIDTAHLDFISVLNNLAVIYNRQKNTEKAVETHKRVLSVVEDILGKDHVFYGDVITNLGVDYSFAGDYDKAIEYHNKALEIKKSIVGEKHIHYVLTLISLADVYERMEKFDRALEIQNTALEIRREIFGEVNEQVSDSLVNLGRISLKKGDISKAQGFLTQALIINKEIILAGAVKVSCYAENIRLMAEACAEGGDIDRAEHFCSSLAEYRKSEYGENHPKYAAALYDGGAVLMKKEYYAQAEKYMEKAAEITEMRMGVNTPFCQRCLYSYGKTLYENKKYSKAEETLKKAASAWKKYSKDGETLTKIMFLQAKNQYMLGFPKKASEIILRASGIAQRELKEKYADIITSEITDYARLVIDSGDGAQVYGELDKIYETASESEPDIRGKYMSVCAEAAYICGKYDEAAERAALAEKYAIDEKTAARDRFLRAKALTAQEKFGESGDILSELKETIVKNNDLYMASAAWVYCLSGVNAYRQDDFRKAKDDFEKGLAEAKARENLPVADYAGYLIMAAEAEEKTGELTKAVEYLSECALIIRRDKGEGKDFADILTKAAAIYNMQQRYDDAVTMYDKASEIYGQFYGAGSKERLDTEYSVCDMLVKAKKYADAADRIENLPASEYRKDDFRQLLASAYKGAGAFGKLIKLSIGKGK